MRILLILGVALILGIIFFFTFLYVNIPSLAPKISKVEIYSQTFGEKIFIKKKNWGLTGDQQVIVVGKSPDDAFEPNAAAEYVYIGLSPFFYKFENDTLNLYVMKESRTPPKLSTKLTISQIILKNPEMMDLIEHFQEKGLKIIE